jgi:hypothetical protein
MEELVYESPVVKAIHQPEEDLVTLHWKSQANTHEYRQMFQSLVEFANKKKIRRIISDMRQEGLVSFDDAKWLDEEILNQAKKLGVERIALVVDDSIFSHVYAENILRKMKESAVRVQLFDDMSSAKGWISS